MYISDKCKYTPYGSIKNLDDIIDNKLFDKKKLKEYGHLWAEDVIDVVPFLKLHDNYGIDEIYKIVTINTIEKSKILTYIASQGYALDELIKAKSSKVRKAVASTGYEVEILINDKDEEVALEALKHLTPEKAINSKNPKVRCEIAKQGLYLDILINDPNDKVRAEVACNGYGLDKLVHDESGWVLAKVANQHYYLDKLLNMRNIDNYWSAVIIKNKYGGSLKKWWDENPDKRYYESFHDIFDNTNINDIEWPFCAALLKDNYYLDYLIKNHDFAEHVYAKLAELECNDIEEWKEKYPDLVYFSC